MLGIVPRHLYFKFYQQNNRIHTPAVDAQLRGGVRSIRCHLPQTGGEAIMKEPNKRSIFA